MQTSVLIQKIKDPKFYLENFCKIKGKKPGQLIPFILNEAQKDLFNTIRGDNRVILNKARQIGFCLSEDTLVLLSSLKWVKIKDVNIGDSVIAVDEETPGNRGQRKMKSAIVENKCSFQSETLKITLSSGRVLVGTHKHKMLSKKWRTGTETAWKTMENMKVGDSIRFITNTWDNQNYEDGWFGGMIDGEGSLSKPSRSGVSLTISQVAGPVFERLLSYVIDNKITYRIEEDRRLPGNTSKFGSKVVYKIVINKMNELFKLFGTVRPSRFMQRSWWEGKSLPNDGWEEIVSIENGGTRNVVDLQTSAKTYIAEGFVSHNSTAVTGFFYHKTITTPGTNTALIGYNSDLTAELLDKVKTFYKTTPIELRPRIQYNSKYEISFPDINSKIIVLPSTGNVGRGYTINNCLVTELSSWEDADDKMMSLEASVPIDGKLVIESTPRGQGNLFHRMFMLDNDYVKKSYGWWWAYTPDEIDIIRRRLNDPMKFAQEYELAFLASGRPVFDISMINEQRKNILKTGDVITIDSKEFKVHEEEGFRIYKMPEEDGLYIFGVDTSEGVEGGDNSSVTVWNRKTGEEVAMFRGLLPPDILATKLDKWGRMYNNALMIVEVNNHGLTVLTLLKMSTYPSLYFRPAKFDQLSQETSDKLGWKTTKMTRPLMIDDFAQALRDGDLIIHSKELLDEMSVFVYNDRGDSVPQQGFHDDCIFSASIGFQGFKIMYDKKLDQIEYQNHLPINFAY